VTVSLDQLLQKYDQPAPRYTSFPTAVHFHDQLSQQGYAGILAGLPEGEPVSLYLHIPFCAQLCHYCGCHTKVVNSYAPIEAYVDLLLREIKLVRGRIGRRLKASHIHFGGGTPNALAISDFYRIREVLEEAFDLSDAELDMESDPRLFTPEQIEALGAIGVRRLSLGVQDFDPDVQKAVNRVQPYEKVARDVELLRKAGIENLNFDMMVGLPLQTLEIVRSNIELALTLNPQRFAVFAYAHVPWMKKHQMLLEKYPMPGSRERYDMAQLVRDMLIDAGYEAIGIDHFAQPDDSLGLAYRAGTMRRNFQGYTDDTARSIIAFGHSSISSYPDCYVQNMSDPIAYKQAIEAGELPIKRACHVSAEDQIRRAAIEQLMCYFRLDLKVLQGMSYDAERLYDLQADGLVELDGNVLRVTEDGWAFARLAATCLDPYYAPEAGRHAKAV